MLQLQTGTEINFYVCKEVRFIEQDVSIVRQQEPNNEFKKIVLVCRECVSAENFYAITFTDERISLRRLKPQQMLRHNQKQNNGLFTLH